MNGINGDSSINGVQTTLDSGAGKKKARTNGASSNGTSAVAAVVDEDDDEAEESADPNAQLDAEMGMDVAEGTYEPNGVSQDRSSSDRRAPNRNASEEDVDMEDRVEAEEDGA